MGINVSFVQEPEFTEALEAFCARYDVSAEEILIGIEWTLERDPFAATEVVNEPVSVFVISVELHPYLKKTALVFFHYEYLAEDQANQVRIHFEDITLSDLDDIFG